MGHPNPRRGEHMCGGFERLLQHVGQDFSRWRCKVLSGVRDRGGYGFWRSATHIMCESDRVSPSR